MKEVDQAKEQIRAIEESANAQVMRIVKDFLLSLKPENFPTELSDKGEIGAFMVGPGASLPVLFATSEGLFHAGYKGQTKTERLQVLTGGMREASPEEYHQYSKSIFGAVEEYVEAKRARATAP